MQEKWVTNTTFFRFNYQDSVCQEDKVNIRSTKILKAHVTVLLLLSTAVYTTKYSPIVKILPVGIKIQHTLLGIITGIEPKP